MNYQEEENHEKKEWINNRLTWHSGLIIKNIYHIFNLQNNKKNYHSNNQQGNEKARKIASAQKRKIERIKKTKK